MMQTILEIERRMYEALFECFSSKQLLNRQKVSEILQNHSFGLLPENSNRQTRQFSWYTAEDYLQASELREAAIRRAESTAKSIFFSALMSAVAMTETNAISDVQGYDGKKMMKFYSGCDLIDFRALGKRYLDFICNKAVFTKESIYVIIQPYHFVLMYDYYKYHKIYDDELFFSFAKMIKLPQTSDYDRFCMLQADKDPNYAKNLIQLAITKIKIPELYRKIYTYAIKVAEVYDSINAFIPDEKVIERELNSIFTDEVYKPNGEKVQDGEAYVYSDIISGCVKRRLIVSVTDTTVREEGRALNDKQLRYCIRILTEKLGLGSNGIHSCPKDLRQRLNVYADYWHDKRKSMFTNMGMILNEEYIHHLGDLYSLIVILYAFDPENYCEADKVTSSAHQTGFRQTIENSIQQSDIQFFLKCYLQTVNDRDYQRLIKQILCA